MGATILSTIEKNPTITILPLAWQFQELVLESLSELQLITPTMVIILDALDKCSTADGETLLAVLAQDFNDFPFLIRTIITSRAKINICNAFQLATNIISLPTNWTSGCRRTNDI
jgi:hypothetical protein